MVQLLPETLAGVCTIVTPDAGRLQESFASVAASSPYSWCQQAPDPVLLATIGERLSRRGLARNDANLDLLYLRLTQAECDKIALIPGVSSLRDSTPG